MGVLLVKRFAAGNFNKPAAIIGNPVQNFRDFHGCAFFIGVSGVTVGASQVAAGQAYKNTGKARI
jgi:hypothetical protein